ncbi:cisplatin damage response ATP-dependent DNA ligase [Sphingomonas radiodurans]|uniref:cisplatin damage response ATP-dependent DNA ligase n=1 Tax=Sphingomonas radiodurans TaxID=2890321 RepID=UPI001E51ED43|nr:cisplatin damage response ATP-dependent DNA ligase [Sphingomonas radiodurans]WBH15160.1 cisplatin damage response ATP-dependent DNA ligase [Sphingomonas radiodurans]
MHAFAQLLDSLIYTRSRNAKLKLIGDYLRDTPDPDRGWAMAALTGDLDIPGVKPAVIRGLIEERVDPVLYRMSRDFVGDSAETIALLWPTPDAPAVDAAPLTVSAVVDQLMHLPRGEAPAVLAGMLDALDADERFALLKMATGALRVGVSARLAKQALANAFGIDVEAVEEVWHGIDAPYASLFAWAEGRGEQPTAADVPVFRPFMLAHPLEDLRVDLADYAAEWKWDGIRVQIVHVAGETRLYSRTGDDVTRAFPDVAAAFSAFGAVDGELLVKGEAQGGALGAGGDGGGGAASFNALQQRLGRKVVSAKMLEEAPAFVRLYDILFDGAEDLRALPWHERRGRLEAFAARLDPERFDVSALIEAKDFTDLEGIRAGARDAAIEGVMLKRRDSPYVTGRRVGLWYKWKRDPLTADCVMMYAQRGSGRRSSFYSDYTFGCWTPEGELLPVGKAYSGITDEELKLLDKFVRTKTVNRFGPVREVEKTLVLEIAFDSIHESKRHKSGVAMRFPRIARIRMDKPAAEADTVAGLRRLIT